MDTIYSVANSAEIPSPALVLFRDLIERNLAEMIRIAGSAERLRPHCKTHKMPALTRRELELGIERHKCATIAEAEMLAQAGAQDIFLAYNIVGPNVARVIALLQKYPQVRLAVTADHADPVRSLGVAAAAAGKEIEVVLDIDTGLGRTGVESSEAAIALYQQIAATPGLQPGGLHLYDGQNHQTDLEERRAAVMKVWEKGRLLRDQLRGMGLAVPRIIAGGTGSFPIYAAIQDPALELSPGTVVLHDAGYRRMFPDLHFTPAALILTRVISLPGKNRVTCDLGYKACASDPPAGQRLQFPDLPDAKEVLQNEEHLVLETSAAAKLKPGDELWAIPRHVCPTTALHREAFIVSEGRVVDRWPIVGRDRILTV